MTVISGSFLVACLSLFAVSCALVGFKRGLRQAVFFVAFVAVLFVAAGIVHAATAAPQVIVRDCCWPAWWICLVCSV